MLNLLSCGGNSSRQRSPSVHSNKKSLSAGFTLIELIVVILIVGLLITFATISVGTSGDKQLETEAKRFYSLMKLASEEAIMNTQEMALELSKNQYQFLVWSETGFQALEGDEGGLVFRPRELPEYIFINVEIEDTKIDFEDIESDELPKIGLFSSGELTPFNITFSQEDGAIFQITGDYSGKIDYVGKVKEQPF